MKNNDWVGNIFAKYFLHHQGLCNLVKGRRKDYILNDQNTGRSDIFIEAKNMVSNFQFGFFVSGEGNTICK